MTTSVEEVDASPSPLPTPTAASEAIANAKHTRFSSLPTRAQKIAFGVSNDSFLLHCCSNSSSQGRGRVTLKAFDGLCLLLRRRLR